MNRTVTIIAVVSVGLNIGLGGAIGYTLWNKSQSISSAPTPFQTTASSEQTASATGSATQGAGGNTPPRLPADCRRALVQTQPLPPSCGPFVDDIAKLPKDDKGAPIIPRRPNGSVDWQELGKLMGRTSPPPRPTSVKALEQALGLTKPQLRALRQMMRATRADRSTLREELDEARTTLAQTVAADDFDQSLALAQYQQTLELRNAALNDQAARYLEFFNGLSLDQRAIVQSWSNGNILKLLE